MATYIVRTAEKKQFVGIFWAENIVDLGWAIDEFLDPFMCEYSKLSAGGVCTFGKKGKMTIPAPEPSNDSDEATELAGEKLGKRLRKSFGRAELSENLFCAFFDDDLRWRLFDMTMDRFIGVPLAKESA